MDLLIRQAKEIDSDWLAECTDAAYSMYVPALGRKPMPMTLDYNKIFEVYQVWIAEYQSTRAGLIMLQDKKDHILIYSLAVLPEWAGKGIGKALLNHAEDETKNCGYSLVRLYTNEKMERNVAMYRRLGYVDSHVELFKGLSTVHLKKELMN